MAAEGVEEVEEWPTGAECGAAAIPASAPWYKETGFRGGSHPRNTPK
jgi:hypothetical protein